MKNKLITTAIIILLIIIAFLIIFNFLQRRTIKQNEKVIIDSRNYISDLNEQIEELKSKPPVTIKEFIKLTDQEQVQAYQDLTDKYNTAMTLLDNTKEKLKDVTNQLEKSNKALKRNDFMFVSGIVGVGFDQEWNLLGQAGLTINGKVFQGKLIPVKVYLGGGASYFVRTDLNKTVHGVCPTFQTTFLIGK